MIDRHHVNPRSASPGLRSVAILVFTAKLMVASFLIAQATLLPPSPLSGVYGLSR